MTEEELKRKIGEVVIQAINDNQLWYNLTYADRILTLIHEAGYKSGEEVEKLREPYLIND